MNSHDPAESGAGAPEAGGLPFEPGSASELLFATHLFMVEVMTAAASPWGVADGLERRRLDLTLRLLALYKGELRVRPGDAFPLGVEQRRESEYFNFSFHGLWSHVEPPPEVGVRYVVVSQGATDSPAALMQEDACVRLLAPEYESDILLAREAEQLFRGILDAAGRRSGGGSGYEPEPEPEPPAAARALLAFAREHAADCRDLFALYLWARVRPSLPAYAELLLPDALALTASPNATLKFRQTLVASVYEAALEFEPDSPPYRMVLATFLALLSQPEASLLREMLVEAQLYNLIFKDQRPRFDSGEVIPDAAERRAMLGALAPFTTERAQRLKVWLSSGGA